MKILVTGGAGYIGSHTVLELVGAAGPGCALVALGISLAQYQLGGGYRTVVLLVGLKNFVFPVAVWLTCRLLGIEGVWLHVAVLLAILALVILGEVVSAFLRRRIL